MPYQSQISFVLDTICPWTYLAKKRLDEALKTIRDNDTATAQVNFTVKYLPYQLNPDFPTEEEDKYEWYKKSKYDGSEEKMQKYITLMTEYGKQAGIAFRFDGTMANTLPAHRLIQHYQAEPHGSAEKADRIVNSLYAQYFEQAQSPAARATLRTAATAAGIDPADAEAFIDSIDPEGYDEATREVKAMIREQAGNGVDSVPYVVFEGKRRDLTLIGAKDVGEYVKAMEQIVNESA